MPRRIAELDTEDRRTLARLTGPYINTIRDYHDDGEGLMEYLEQLIAIEGLDFLAGRVKPGQFHGKAAELSEGRHKLPIRLAAGQYGSDDEWTLKKGAKPGVDTDLGPDYGQGRKVYPDFQNSETGHVYRYIHHRSVYIIIRFHLPIGGDT